MAQLYYKSGSSWFNGTLNIAYPVGALYQSFSSTSPATLFGGTWSQVMGRFLYCDNNISTGGSNSHTLSIAEMPTHSHGLWYSAAESTVPKKATFNVDHWDYVGWGGDFMDNTGGSQPHNNMPAYQSCYTWRRTA